VTTNVHTLPEKYNLCHRKVENMDLNPLAECRRLWLPAQKTSSQWLHCWHSCPVQPLALSRMQAILETFGRTPTLVFPQAAQLPESLALSLPRMQRTCVGTREDHH